MAGNRLKLSPRQCKVARAVAVNCDDAEGGVCSKNRFSRTVKESRESEDPADDVSKANTGQLVPETRGERLLKLMHEFTGLLAKDAKVVGVKHGRKAGLPLNNRAPLRPRVKRKSCSRHMAVSVMEQINCRNIPLSTSS